MTSAQEAAGRASSPRRSGFTALLRGEALATARDTAGLLIPVALPLLLLISNSFADGIRDPLRPGGPRVFDVYVVPPILSIVVAIIALVNMPSFIATYRRTGVLKTLAVSPIRPASVVLAQIVVSAIQLVAGTGLMIAVAVAAFDLHRPVEIVPTVAAFAVGVTSMYALGMLVAVIAPSPNAAIAIGMVIFLATGAIGGMFGSTENYPEALATIGSMLPFGALVQLLQAGWLGEPLPLGSLAAAGATILVCGALSTLLLRRRPR